MRPRIQRNLNFLFEKESSGIQPKGMPLGHKAPKSGVRIPPELAPRQYAILLLHIAATIEHSLMIQYLYAGYSLGGNQIPVEYRERVAQWREIILGIAKEEMGHLMTIQNLLRCIGGPLNLDREDYPWDSEFLPFSFQLEPLSSKSLAKYVYSESPDVPQWSGEESKEILNLIKNDAGKVDVHRVGVLYSELLAIFADSIAIKDSDFRESTFPFQANWDEWGRGYKKGARGNSAGGAVPKTPDVLIVPVSSRSDALKALRAIATQGEANPSADENSPSHFARFLKIFREFPHDKSWSPNQNVAINPIVGGNEKGDKDNFSSITHPETLAWANLFNLRYRILLISLLHTFEYPSELVPSSQNTPRGLLLHCAFGEMYNIRALAQILFRSQLTVEDTAQLAGPPFQMPFTLALSQDKADQWRTHLDLIDASATLIDLLMKSQSAYKSYLTSLRDIDQQIFVMIGKLQHE